jgi:chaperonin cofactor prefoldin
MPRIKPPTVRHNANATPPADAPAVETVADVRETEARAAERAAAAAAESIQQHQRAALQQRAVATEVQSLQETTIANALDAARLEAEKIESQWIYAKQTGDAAAEVAAQRAMAEVDGRISVLEDGLAELRPEPVAPAQPQPQRVTEGVVRAPNAPAQLPPQPRYEQPVQQQLPPAAAIEAQLANMPALMESERAWIRQHPEALSDPRKVQQMDAIYRLCEARGITRGTDEYFATFDREMGYASGGRVERTEPRHQAAPAEEYEPDDMGRRTAAPVSRGSAPAVGNGMSPGRVVLTQQEREIARRAREGPSAAA